MNNGNQLTVCLSWAIILLTMRNLLVSCFGLIMFCCSPVDKPSQQTIETVSFPERAKDMTIYEVNIRQYTPEGTFNAFAEKLPRLKELGVDMLWIMPIQAIGEKNRKGSLGSYYSIRDYKATNPEFGTLEDFKALVNKAHELGFVVILDWVPNHSAWDNAWVTEHPEYYMTDSAAQFVNSKLKMGEGYYKKKGIGDLVYEADWDDIALLNLYNPDARAAMIDAMKYWVTEADIDGFRADHPTEEIPMFFWEEATKEINPIKDLFWLAERDEARVHLTFHASYEWGLLSMTEHIAEGKAKADDLHDHILYDMALYGRRPFRLNMITNHDRNAWEGTVFERYGDGAKAMAVFSFVSYGMPVLYSGQEAGMNKRLKFFEKDAIDWSDPDDYFSFYQKLNQIKSENKALWAGEFGGVPQKIEDGNENVFSSVRSKDGNKVIAIINMSGQEQQVQLGNQKGKFTEAFSNQPVEITSIQKLGPWQYYILIGN